MKTILILLCFISPLLTMGQAQIPNSDLETWRTTGVGDEIPDNGPWEDPDSSGIINGYPRTIFKTTDAYQGQYALKIVSSDSNGLRSYGDIFMGNCCVSGTPYGSLPYADRPDSLVFYYKYITQNPDTASVTFQLMRSTTDTIVGGIFEFLLADTAYTRVSFPVTYGWNLAPNKIFIRFSSTYSNYLGTGTSSLYIDSINLVNKTVVNGIGNNTANNAEAFLYPSPANNQLFIKTHQTGMANVQLFDITGRLLVNTQLQDNANIDVSHLSAGMLFYTITDTAGNLIGRGKICKQ